MNAEEEHWWKNLQALHQVNIAWNFDRSQTLFQALKLENLLMHRSLNTRLNQLEREIWILQSEIACQSLEEKYPIYREGAVFFKKRWEHLNTQKILKLQDIREMLFALYDSPFAGYPHQEGFFIQRATQKKSTLASQNLPPPKSLFKKSRPAVHTPRKLDARLHASYEPDHQALSDLQKTLL